MAVRLIKPWAVYRVGDTINLGTAQDEKLIKAGLAEKLADFEEIVKPSTRRKEGK